LQLSLTESAEALRSQGPPTLPAVDSSTLCQPSFGDLSNSSGLTQSFTPPPCQSTPQQALGDEKTSKPVTPELLLSYSIPHHLVGDTMQAIQQSDKHHLLALKLLQLLFTKEELSTSNCSGNFGKQQLDGIHLELMKCKCHFISSLFLPWSGVLFFHGGREKERVLCLSSTTTTKGHLYRRLFLIQYTSRKL